MKKPSNLKTYLENQMLEMLKHKWIKGVHLGKDPGNEACEEWIEKYAENYRKEFNSFFDEVVSIVVRNCKDSMPKEIKESCSDETLMVVAKILIEEFTNVWLMERIKPCPNPHAGEV